MSYIDSINGFKKKYTTEYKDNNKCPYDETVENVKEQASDIVKFPKYENELILDYATASYASVSKKDFKEDEEYKTTVNFEEDENEFENSESFDIKHIEKDSHFGYDT